MVILRFFVISFSLFFFSSCGSDEDRDVNDAIEKALSFLTIGDCQSAINELEAVGRHPAKYLYVKTLSSSYACRAGYSTLALFDKDLEKIGSNGSPLGGMAQFTTSDTMDEAQEQSFIDLQEAIDILLYAGGFSKGLNPTISRRSLYFNEDEVGNINAQLLYMILVQLGKYLNFFGDSDQTGVKGSNGNHNCIMNYSNVTLSTSGSDLNTYITLLGVGGNTCGSLDDGSSFLGDQGDINVKRACQGVVLFNNLIEVLPIVVSQIGGEDFDDLDDLTSDIDTYTADIVAAESSMAEILTVQSQSLCRSLYSGDTDSLEIYFAFFFENLFL